MKRIALMLLLAGLLVGCASWEEEIGVQYIGEDDGVYTYELTNKTNHTMKDVVVHMECWNYTESNTWTYEQAVDDNIPAGASVHVELTFEELTAGYDGYSVFGEGQFDIRKVQYE